MVAVPCTLLLQQLTARARTCKLRLRMAGSLAGSLQAGVARVGGSRWDCACSMSGDAAARAGVRARVRVTVHRDANGVSALAGSLHARTHAAKDEGSGDAGRGQKQGMTQRL